MKPYRFAALLALSLPLSLAASLAHAGRDEILIQQTRKNQLAHDARARQARQDQARQQKEEKNAPPQPQQQQQQR